MIILPQLQKRFSHSFAKSARVGTEKPTKYIYLLIFIFVALFMQAYIHNYNIVYLTLFFTFAFSIASYPLGRNNIRALEVQLLSFERVFVAQTSFYTVSLSGKQDVYDVTCISEAQQLEAGFIKVGEHKQLRFSHRYESRGKETLKTLQCESGFVLPHQTFYKVFDINHDFLVYPEP